MSAANQSPHLIQIGNRAFYSQRLIKGQLAPYDSAVKLPGDSYEPRCAEHFVLPGCPH
jgi:thymidine kinase